MRLGFLANSLSVKLESSRCQLSLYQYAFDGGLVSWDEATVEPGRNCLNNGAALTDLKLPKVPAIFVKGESTSLSEGKLLVSQFFAPQYPADPEESSVVALEEPESIIMLAGDLEGEDDWDLADLTNGPDLGS